MPNSLPLLKRLEIAWRRIWIRALTRLMRRDARDGRPDWGARRHRVLFLRHDRIGDMILSTGLLRAIARSQPTITLDVLASPANAPVIREDPHVDSVVVFDRTKPWHYLGALRRLRRAQYDAVIDCMPTAPSLTTLLLIAASGATHRIGVAGRGNDAAFTLLVQPLRGATHIVDHLAALAAAFGVDPLATNFRPCLYLQERERSWAAGVWEHNIREGDPRRLLVNVSAGREFRRWRDDRFVAAIRHALALDARLNVVVIGTPNESERATAIAGEAQVRFVPTPTLREALALVATADAVFTPDTGLAHAASAFDRPAVVLYVQGTDVRWGLYGSKGYPVSSLDGSLASLPLEPVLNALDELLANATHGRPPTVSEGESGHSVRPPTDGPCASLPSVEGRVR
jgi:ADP-heptose:LPS heptosyltransferase